MDISTIFLIVAFGGLIFFMFRSNKKRQTEANKLREQAVVGAEVMTSFGLFGTIVDVDDEENTVTIETTPGTALRVHRQAVARVVTPDVTEDDAETDAEFADGSATGQDGSVGNVLNGEPEFGELAPDADQGKSDK